VSFLLLAILIVFSSGKISGQSRNYKPERPFIQSQSEKLRSASGWQLDALGNWISNENAISDTKLTETTRYTVPQNFKWIQFALLKNGKQDIYALLYENTVYISGTQSERRVYYFLMTSKSYATIVSTVENKTGESISIHSSSFGYMSDSDGVYTANKLLTLMGQSILDAEKSPKYVININAQHVDSEDVVRFRLPERENVLVDENLQKSYFEVVWKNFKQILLPISVQAQSGEFDLGNVTVSPSDIEQSLNDDIVDRTPAKNQQQEDFSLSAPEQVEQIGEAINNGPVAEQESFDEITDRVTKETAIVSAPIALLSNIEGWYLNPAGEWVTDNSHTYRFETVGKYEMRNFKYRDKDYILITRFEKYAGSSFYLIAKDDYVNTLIGLERSSMLRFPVVVYAGVGNTLRDMIELSEKTIDAPEKKDAVIFRDNYLVLQYKLSMQKNVSRFFIYYQECSKYGSDTSRENCSPRVSNKIKYDDEAILGSDVLFNKAYYESTYNDFMGFFRKPVPSGSGSRTETKTDRDELELELR